MNELTDQFEMTDLALRQMNNAVHNSFLHPEELSKNLVSLDLAEELLPNKFELAFLRQACHETVMKNWFSTQISEKDVHAWFKANAKAILGDEYKIVRRKNDRKHIPDFWLESQSEFIPVEIKLREFGDLQLSQLQRYMNFYKCSRGVAVADELKCILPDNVRFIKFNRDEVEAR